MFGHLALRVGDGVKVRKVGTLLRCHVVDVIEICIKAFGWFEPKVRTGNKRYRDNHPLSRSDVFLICRNR